MPKINVQGYGPVNFPDDMSQEQIANVIENEYIPHMKQHIAKEGFIPGVKAGLQSGLGNVETFLGENLGMPSLSEAGKQNKAEAATKYEEPYAGETAAAFQRGILPGVGTAISNVTGPVGNILGTFGPTALTGVAAAPLLPEELAGLTLSTATRRAIGTTVANGFEEAGQNIDKQKDLHPDQKVNLLAADLTGLIQGAIDTIGVPGLGKLSNKLAPQLENQATKLSKQIVDGEITHAEAAKSLSSKWTEYLGSTASNFASGAGMMTADEALRRAQAGEDVTSPEALESYKHDIGSALLMSPVFGAYHVLTGSGRGEANRKLDEAQATKTAKDQAIADAQAKREMDIKTGVMQQQPMFTEEQAPSPAGPPAPEAQGPSTLTQAEPDQINKVEQLQKQQEAEAAGQQSLFDEKGKPTPEIEQEQAKSRVQQNQEKVNTLLATPEGTKQVIDNIKDYFFDYTKADQNKIRTQLQQRMKAFTLKDEDVLSQKQKEYEQLFSVIEPVPEHELTSQKLQEAGIKGSLAAQLKDKSLKDPAVYNKVADVANDLKNTNASAAAKLLDGIQAPEGVKNVKRTKSATAGESDAVSLKSEDETDTGTSRDIKSTMGFNRVDNGRALEGAKDVNAALKEAKIYETKDESGQEYLGLGEKKEEVAKEEKAAKTPEEIKQAELDRKALLEREQKLSKKLHKAGEEASDIYASQKEGEENKNLDLSTTTPAELTEGSTFQRKFKNAKTLGDALKTLKKMPISKGQQALANLLLNTKNISDVAFETAKHPQPKDIRKKGPKTYIGEFTGEKRTMGEEASKKLINYEKFTGEYDSSENKARLYQSGNAESLLHEGIHAATAHEIDKHIDHVPDPRGAAYGVTPVAKPNSVIGKRWVRMFNAAKEAAKNRNEDYYGLDDIHEFVAEALNPHDNKFRQLLKNTAPTSKAKPRGRLPSLFTEFIQNIMDLLGVPQKYESLFHEILDHSSELFKGPDLSIDKDVAKLQAAIEGKPATYVDAGKGLLQKVKHFSIITDSPGREHDVEELLSSPNAILDKLPEFDNTFKDKALNWYSKATEGMRKYWLGALELSKLHMLYGKELPSIKTLETAVKDRNHFHVIERKHIDNLANKGIIAIQKYSKPIVDKFNNTIHELSRLDIDPRDPKNKDHELVKSFNSLPEELKSLAKDIVNSYEDYRNKYVDFVANAVPSKSMQIRKKFESSQKPFYVPLLRRGQYWLQYMNPNGEMTSIAKDSPREINMIKDALVKQGMNPKDIKLYSKLQDISHRTAPPSGFVADVLKIMKEGGATEKSMDDMYHTYLSLFPTESIRQSFNQRRGDLGYIQDLVQGYARTAPKMASQLANLKYAPEIDKAYSNLKEDFIKSGENKVASDVMHELMERRKFIDNPSAEWWAYRASQANFLMSIAGNISSALVNTTAVPMVALQHIAVDKNGNYNYTRASEAIAKATKMFFQGGYDDSKEYLGKIYRIRTFGVNDKLSPEYKDLHDKLLKSGVLTYSIGRELHSMAEAPSDKYQLWKDKANTLLGLTFEGTERFNREVTALAAYDVARQDGYTHEQAIQKAIDLTARVHTEAIPEAGPRWLQGQGAIGGLQKIALTFKRFTLAQILNMGMLSRDMFKDAKTADELMAKKIAVKQLLGILGATYMFAGLQGLPGYGLVNAAANFFGSDSDEPFDLDEYIRNAYGDIGLTGPINAATGIDIASRTGFNGALWREDKKRLADVGYVAYAMENLMGPTFSNLENMEKGVKQMTEGQYERGLEKMVPSPVRNVMKAFRFSAEGALNPNGAPVIDNVSDWNKFMQVFGFSDAELTEQYARSSAMKSMEKTILDRRKALLDSMFLALSNGDESAQTSVTELISKFNEKHPEIAITAQTIQSSYKNRERAINESVGGVHFNRKLLPELQEMYKEEE